MSWHDLQDDLARGVPAQHRKFYPTADAVARRVLALWQPCGDCEGKGQHLHPGRCPDEAAYRARGTSCLVAHYEMGPCSHCGGTGLTPSETGMDIYPSQRLARYLFGGER